MRRAVPAVLIVFVAFGCAKAEQPPPPTTTTVPPPPTTMPSPTPPVVQEAHATLASSIGIAANCQVTDLTSTDRIHAWPDDVVRWAFRTGTAQCKGKRPRIMKFGSEIDCRTSAVVKSIVLLPLEDCDRDIVTDDVGLVVRLACSVKSGAEQKCYKYTIGGNITHLDPEIEIEGPRATPPPPPVTTLPSKSGAGQQGR